MNEELKLKYGYQIKILGNSLLLYKEGKIKGVLMDPIIKPEKLNCIKGVEKEINNSVSEAEADIKVSELCIL